MKITIKRSRWPWGTPSVVVDLSQGGEIVSIDGARSKKIITGFHTNSNAIKKLLEK